MSLDKKIVTDFFKEVYNLRNFDYILEYYANDYYEHRGAGARTNKEAIKITKMACQIFPDLSVSIEDVIEDGDLIAVRAIFSGTHTLTYIDAPPTNKHIEWEAMEFFRMKDNIIVESWGSWPNYDILVMLKQK